MNVLKAALGKWDEKVSRKDFKFHMFWDSVDK